MTLISPRDPASIRKTVPLASVTVLGRLGDQDYIEHGGVEYAVSIAPASMPDYARRADELWLSDRTTNVVDGTETNANIHRRGVRVPSGTFVRMQDFEQRRIAKLGRGKSPRPIDLRSFHAAFAAKSDTIIPGPGAKGVLEDVLRPVSGIDASGGGFVAGRPARDLDGFLAYLARRGVVLIVTPSGRLRVDAPRGRLTRNEIATIATFAPLIVGRRVGTPVACEATSHAAPVPAVTILALDVPACSECAGER